LKKIEHITLNELYLATDQPQDYTFTPEQATEISIDKDVLRNERRPFAITCLPDDHELEFTIKVYPSPDGGTEQLEMLNVGGQLLIDDTWGAITYKEEGTFISKRYMRHYIVSERVLLSISYI
jgi:predicted ferric reductase